MVFLSLKILPLPPKDGNLPEGRLFVLKPQQVGVETYMMRGCWERLTLALENLRQGTAVPEGNIPFLTPERRSALRGGGLEETLCISPGPLVSPVRCVVFLPFFFSIYLFLALLGLHHGKPGLFSSCGAWASPCGGFSRCGARALGLEGFSSCGSRVLEHRLSNCGMWAQLH